jgi:hypothetical protein
MSYTVTETTLAPIPNVHGGTGTHQATNWVVDPATVPGSAPMTFSGLDEQVTTKLFAIADNVVPNWFGVALPRGLSDFTRPHIFFHPTPGQAGYVDGDYANKTGKWPELFYYMERLGYQLDGARRNQIIIMPFMTEQAKTGGILPVNWQDIVTQILQLVHVDIAPSQTSPLSISQLVVSSFSAGMIYSDNFRRTGVNVASVLAEVWDFDGLYSSYKAISQALHNTATVQAIKYDQVPSADASAYHVPLARWTRLVNPPISSNEVHGLIRDFMFLDAATVSGVGSVIDSAASGTTADTGTHTETHTGTHTGTATHSGAGTQSGTGTHTAHTGTTSHSATATHSGTASHTGTAHTGTATHSGAMPSTGPSTSSFPPLPVSALLAPLPGPGTFPAIPGETPTGPMPTGVPAHTPSMPDSTTPRGGSAPVFQPQQAGRCCPAAIPALVAAVASTAQTALTGITAIAAHGRKRG